MSTIDFHSLAKTELHCHLDGSLSLPTIRQLAAMANIDLPASDEELKHHVTAPAHCENLLDYLEAFDYIRPLRGPLCPRIVHGPRTYRPRNYRCCL